MKRRSVLLTLSALALATGAHATDEATAKEILDRMANAYHSAHSYSDTGSVHTVFVTDEGRRRSTELHFTTAFVRPQRFRFEYNKDKGLGDEGRYIIWAHGKDVRTWWAVKPGVESALSIGHALGAAAGVSGGTSMTVPTQLMPAEACGAWAAGARVIEYTDPARLQDDTLNGVSCFRLAVKRHRETHEEPSTMWIEKGTYLIRRVDARHRFSTFRTEDTTIYEPVIDGEIDAGRLLLGAPDSKGVLTKP